MPLPASKQPLPGFRLITDDAGSYIDDVNNIRLGPEFVLSRNTSDPSAAISVADYIAAQIAAASTIEAIVSQEFSASSVTIPFTANKYKRITVNIDINGGYLNTIAMTGLSTGSYYYENITGSTSTPGASGATAQDNWVPAGTSAVTSARLDFNVFPAPAKKAVFFQDMSGGSLAVSGSGQSTDTTHNPTGIVITFDASRVGYVYAVGYK